MAHGRMGLSTRWPKTDPIDIDGDRQRRSTVTRDDKQQGARTRPTATRLLRPIMVWTVSAKRS